VSSLNIRSGQGDYSVDFYAEIPSLIEELLKVPHALFAIDEKILQLYPKELAPLLESRPSFPIPATEDEKTLKGVERLAVWLQEQKAIKQSTLVTIGGGIIQDICAFTAHVYFRGIPWMFVPTTLLSMCDSCIGAKCSINLGLYKNQLGTFQSPKRVFIASDFTRTLTGEDVASGYGEILKLMLTGSTEHLAFLEHAIAGTGLRNASLLELIRRSLEVKKRVIEADEYERDLRRILNYGHTFGHALESVTRHEICHGLAAAWGLDLINYISWKRGLLPEGDFKRIHEFIRKNLPFRLKSNIGVHDLISAAQRDKKVADGMVNLVLFAGPGNLRIVKTPFDATLAQQIGDYLEQHNVYR
jgi:3-dehydroquinate synthase